MNQPSNDERTFEQALAELDRIVHDLEDGQIGLEESLSRYEQGVGLLKRCYTHLRDAEQRILVLTGVDEEGQPVVQPFQHAATAETRGEVKRLRARGEDGKKTP